jgi:osmoprotectant transport system ATP-binding protein
MIQLQQVSKRYEGRTVLHSTDLHVREGEVHALLGASGCGKSTLLRIVVGTVRPDSGQVRIAGEVMTPANTRQVRHSLGYVVQDGGLFPHLNARENVALLARHLGWDGEKIRARLQELTTLAGITPDVLDRYPVQLSGGQRQRVGLMRALMLDPPVLLMDEPLGALDPLIRSRLQDDLKGIFSRLRKTVILVTHDMAEAAFLAGVISVMRDGRILQTGLLRELAEAPAEPYVSEFISAQRRTWLEEALP